MNSPINPRPARSKSASSRRAALVGFLLATALGATTVASGAAAPTPAAGGKFTLTLSGNLEGVAPVTLSWSGDGPDFSVASATDEMLTATGTIAPDGQGYVVDVQLNKRRPIVTSTTTAGTTRKTTNYATTGIRTAVILRSGQTITLQKVQNNSVSLTLTVSGN